MQCYLPPGSGDFPAFAPAEAGTRFSDPGGMQGWVDLEEEEEEESAMIQSAFENRLRAGLV